MRILLSHNYYQSSAPSGENRVFENERWMLKNNGHILDFYIKDNDELSDKNILKYFKTAIFAPWNPITTFQVKKKIINFKPDLIHIHNTFPLISPSIFHISSKFAPIVLTLHNFRIFCPSALFLRDGKICTQCIDRNSILPSLRYACYRKSRIATFPIALKVALHKKLLTWKKKIDAFIVFSEFHKNFLEQNNIPPEKIFIKSNFQIMKSSLVNFNVRKNQILFVGRLSKEKGLSTLIKAWELWGNNAPILKIIGDGPLFEYLKIEAKNLNIQFLGRVEPNQTKKLIENSKLIIVPSECYEGFPLVISEAFAAGTPTCVSNIGSLPQIVKDMETGVTFKCSDSNDLYNKVKKVWNNQNLLKKMSEKSYLKFKDEYNHLNNYKNLLNIYEAAKINFSKRS